LAPTTLVGRYGADKGNNDRSRPKHYSQTLRAFCEYNVIQYNVIWRLLLTATDNNLWKAG